MINHWGSVDFKETKQLLWHYQAIYLKSVLHFQSLMKLFIEYQYTILLETSCMQDQQIPRVV